MKRSASLLIRNTDRKFLLIQRGEACKNFRDFWEFPGGKIDGDESPSRALVREVREETCFEVNIPDGPPRNLIRTENGGIEYSFFYQDRFPNDASVKLSAEHKDFRWVSFTDSQKLPMLKPHRDFLERCWHLEQIEAYGHELSNYKIYAETLKAILERLKARWSPLAIVQAREKSLSSFAEKCLRKADKYDDPVHQLTDLCGARIIVPTTDEAETLVRRINSLFVIDELDDTAKRHEITAFGYLSVHFLVRVPAGKQELEGVAIPSEIGQRVAEIQVRTLLQHAHSEVTHDRLYKSSIKAPEQYKREAARVAAMLESTDHQFASFVRNLDAYVANYSVSMSADNRRREMENVEILLQHEPNNSNKPALALRVARLARAGWDWALIIKTLEPHAKAAAVVGECIRMELGNALCRQHVAQPGNPEFRRGLRLLESVATCAADSATLEKEEKIRCATALGWQGWALSQVEGQRAAARECLERAVQLDPDDPYHFTSLVELDVTGTGTVQHLPVLAPGLRQAAGRCEDHVRAGIEVARAWFTLTKLRLFLGDDSGALEALLLGARSTDIHQQVEEFLHAINRLNDAIGAHKTHCLWLSQTAVLLTRFKQCLGSEKTDVCTWMPLERQFEHDPKRPVVIFAGATAPAETPRIAGYESHIEAGLEGFNGCVITGGTNAGICGLVARIANRLNAAGRADIQLVGYLPHTLPSGIAPGTGFTTIVRVPARPPYRPEFSILEPLQMWTDLLMSGVPVDKVKLFCLGGGSLSAAELGLAWMLGATSAVVNDGSEAAERFSKLLDWAGDQRGRGVVLPDDPATIRVFFPFDPSVAGAQWDKSGEAVHNAYLDSQRKSAKQPNLLPWAMLREDFKLSNRHQAACSVDILRKAGFVVEPTTLPADQIPLLSFSNEEIATMAEMEHGRWNAERLLVSGWRFAQKKDEGRRLSPWLVSWRELPTEIKRYDLDAVASWPKILAQAGWQVSRPSVPKQS